MYGTLNVVSSSTDRDKRLFCWHEGSVPTPSWTTLSFFCRPAGCQLRFPAVQPHKSPRRALPATLSSRHISPLRPFPTNYPTLRLPVLTSSTIISSKPPSPSSAALCFPVPRLHHMAGPIMNSKNWSDRADKDLFFTILSIKNIGIISGPEWTTIGEHMRTLGYGFTNEGCRYVMRCDLYHDSCLPWIHANALH